MKHTKTAAICFALMLFSGAAAFAGGISDQSVNAVVLFFTPGVVAACAISGSLVALWALQGLFHATGRPAVFAASMLGSAFAAFGALALVSVCWMDLMDLLMPLYRGESTTNDFFYFCEWTHRALAGVIGALFLGIPFAARRLRISAVVASRVIPLRFGLTWAGIYVAISLGIATYHSFYIYYLDNWGVLKPLFQYELDNCEVPGLLHLSAVALLWCTAFFPVHVKRSCDEDMAAAS